MQPLTLSNPQGIFLQGLKTKFRAYVGGFGSGKTFVGCLDLINFAAEHPGTVQGYFGISYPSIRDIFFPTFEEAAEMLGYRVVIRVANKEVHIYRGSRYVGTVICRSMDKPSTIIGFKISRALVDEIDVLPTDKAKIAWQKIIARLRLVIKGVVNGIGVTTTPEGFRFVYSCFAENPTDSYSMVQASTHENRDHLPPDYIPSLLETYDEELALAYVDGKFVNLTSGTVYRNYQREACGSNEEIKPKEPLYIGQDFNVGRMASVVYVQREQQRESVWHAVGEITDGEDTPSTCETIHNRFAGHAIYIYPDASGKNRNSTGASTSDIAILVKAGFKVRSRSSNPLIKDRVLSANTAFEKGRVRVNVRRCPKFAQSLEQQAYDTNGKPDKSTGHDHLNDAGTYPIVYEMPINRPSITSKALPGFH